MAASELLAFALDFTIRLVLYFGLAFFVTGVFLACVWGPILAVVWWEGRE